MNTKHRATEQHLPKLIAKLREEITGEIRFDDVSRSLYSTDASVYEILPAGIVIPRSRTDVVRTVVRCREHGMSITARGGGTSQAGQAIGAGVQLDFSKYMNRILEFEPDARTVTVEPGIVLDELNAFLKQDGLQLPLDISTSNRATIGGMISNNSSGTRSVVYGKTLDYVEELVVVLADGRVVEMRPLDDEALTAKCERSDLEGECYRATRKLATDHSDEIEKRYPKILRRVGGYNLDEFVPSRSSWNLSRLLVGAEGTLGVILEAKLRLVNLPKARVVCAVQFRDLLDAMHATPAILSHKPSAVELVDRFILDTTQGKPEFEPLRDFIVGNPAAVLLVEFFGDDRASLETRLDTLETDLRERALGYHIHRAIEPASQERIWKLRKAALGLSMSQSGDAKAISFVEDSAVAPERLHDYIERFMAILSEENTPAGFYAHASVGLLHIRPVVNMKTAAGVEKFRCIAERVSDLVIEFGGALSGEHGDGLVRAPFQEKMFGAQLYGAFRELKRAFDPDGVFNPGKIVNAAPLTANLRFGPDYETREHKTTFDFSDFGGILRAAEQCGGVGACRKTLTGTMCPSYMATREETDSTRGRANVLRRALAGELGPAGLADSKLHPVLRLCLECKACKTECPTGVDMARLKSEFLHQHQQQNGTPWRSQVLAGIECTARWGSRCAPLSNWLVQNRLTRWVTEKLLGLDRRRTQPHFARRSFLTQWHRRHPQHKPSTSDIALFADTFTNYYEPEHALAAAACCEHVGKKVIVPDRVCCGRPLISKGFLDQARAQAKATTQTLLPLAERGLLILFCEPSCYSAVRDDHPHLLRGELKENAKKVAAACVTFEEWAAAEIPKLTPGPRTVLLHGHCHQKALVGTAPTVELLRKIPNCKVREVDSGCCGLAGSFGYERENYDLSAKIGERKLLPAVRGKDSETLVVAPGFSCRHQISHFTDVKPVSPAQLVAEHLR